VLDKIDSTFDDLILSEIVAGVIAARLDAFYLAEQLRQAAATEERIRLARDLHDGVLQSFTGIALRTAVWYGPLYRRPRRCQCRLGLFGLMNARRRGRTGSRQNLLVTATAVLRLVRR